jgi:hypothetical protein
VKRHFITADAIKLSILNPAEGIDPADHARYFSYFRLDRLHLKQSKSSDDRD